MGVGSSTLGLLFEIDADPSKATAAMQQFSTQTQADLGAFVEGVTPASQAAETFVSGIANAAEGTKKFSGETRESREAMRGLGEEIGVGMPRFVSSYLSSIGPVAEITSAAFAPIAVLGMLDVLGRFGDKIGSLIDDIEGLDKASIKAWDEDRKAIDDAVLSLIKYDDKMRALQTVGLSGTALLTQEQINNAKSIDEVNAAYQRQLVIRDQDKAKVDALKEAEENLKASKAAGDDGIMSQKDFDVLQAAVKEFGSADLALKEWDTSAKEAAATAETLRKQLADLNQEALKQGREQGVDSGQAQMQEFFDNAERFVRAWEKIKEQPKELQAAEAELQRKLFESQKAGEAEREKDLEDFDKRVVSEYLSQSKKIQDTDREQAKISHDINEQEIRDQAELDASLKKTDEVIIRVYKDKIEEIRKAHTLHRQEIEDYEQTAQAAVTMASSIMSAMGQKKAAEIAAIVGTAALKMAEAIGDGLDALPTDPGAAAVYFAAAAQYGVVAGTQVAGMSGSGGGVSRSQVFGSGGSSSAIPLQGATSPLAPGSSPKTPAGYSGGSATVMIVGGASAVASLTQAINAHVRSGGGQLSATHASDGSRL